MAIPRQRACMLGASILFMCSVLYVPLLLSIRPPAVIEWMSMKRDLRIYVLPENDTAVFPAEDICAENSLPELVLIIIVCSATTNYDAREAIRSSWGSIANESLARLIFLLGRPDNDTIQDSIARESETYRDIVQEDFVDTYNNLTLKTVMMLKWVNAHCKRAKYILKTDDDTFVNLRALSSLLQQRGRPKLLLGSLICGAVPIKDRKSKWYAPHYMFGEGFYPNYLSGTAYVISQDLIRPLYKTALETPLFHLEDVFLTGICARKMHIRPRDHLGFSYQKRRMDPCLFRMTMTGHRMKPNETLSMWRLMNDPDLKCNVTKNMRLRNYHPQRCR